MTTGPIPRGFTLATSDAGEWTLSYRAAGAIGLGCFFTVWLGIWTTGCVVATFAVLTGRAEGWALAFLMIWLVPGWFFEFVVAAYALWFFFSVTTFTLGTDQLVVERSLWGYRRRRAFPRAAIRAVSQVKDGGEGEDSFPGWGLVVSASSRVKVLTRQPIDKSNWLGPVLAEWAGVVFEPWVPPDKQSIESI
jgi:hypothetical protein